MAQQTKTQKEADLSWRSGDQPWSEQFSDVYFSAESGIDESRYVFLDQNLLESRWQTLKAHENFIILETGFGTGLNFLTTWQRWLKFKKEKNIQGRLHFISIEKFPLATEDLRRSLGAWPELQEFSTQLTNNYPPTCVPGLHKISFGSITLSLFFGDIVDGLCSLLPLLEAGPKTAELNPTWAGLPFAVDAIYLDGFAPAKNPEMWSDSVFALLAKLSANDTRFATFTAAGQVKRGLQNQGFVCEKIKGFGRKREMLRGYFRAPDDEENTPVKTNSPRKEHAWHLMPARSNSNNTLFDHATIIGGGLAACHLAHALAIRGIKVRILERNAALAQEASGNQRGIIYTRLSPHSGPLSEFNLRALLFSCQFYEANQLFDLAGQQCGVLHLAANEKEKNHYTALAKMFSGQQGYVQYLNPEEASSLAGIHLEHGGLFLPKSGWLEPGHVCRLLCEHENIEVLTNHSVENIEYNDQCWQLSLTQNNENQATRNQSLSSRLLFIANANDARGFPACASLPVKKIRGQVSYCETYSGKLPAVALCGEGYVTSLSRNANSESGLCFGASFNLQENTPQLREKDHLENLDRLLALSPDFATIKNHVLQGRVGFRCTSSDYFPIAGPVAQEKAMNTVFAPLSQRAKTPVDSCGFFEPGLFCLLALGSRGLAYAPLLADTLASAICAEPLPLSRDLWRHIHPARFQIRNLVRNQASP